MYTVRIPKVIKFGENALGETEYPKNALVVTTVPPELSDKWLGKMGIQDYMLYDKVKPEPSIDDVNALISEFKSKNPSALIGLGGGSSMDVVKYAGQDFGPPPAGRPPAPQAQGGPAKPGRSAGR